MNKELVVTRNGVVGRDSGRLAGGRERGGGVSRAAAENKRAKKVGRCSDRDEQLLS